MPMATTLRMPLKRGSDSCERILGFVVERRGLAGVQNDCGYCVLVQLDAQIACEFGVPVAVFALEDQAGLR